MERTVIKGGNVWNGNGFDVSDVVLANGFVEEVAVEVIPGPEDAVVEAKGKFLVPGLVDMHVHFREPGLSYKETIRTGSLAAAAGGFTAVCTMPNVNPVPDTLENLSRQLEIIGRDACVEVLPYASITEKRMGEKLVDYKTLAPYVAGFSDDGTGIQDGDVMRRAMEGIAPTGKILAAHCEVEKLLNKGYIHDGNYARSHGHRGICSESEWKEIERDIRLAEETGCRLHICHISAKESVDLIRRAKARGVDVTCETGPHYLTFCDEDLQEHGRFKMNPPIRSRADRDALRQGLADGTIDCIATDHAPHSKGEKGKGLENSAMGVVGLETAFAAVYTTMVKSGLMPFERLVEVMSVAPRRILRLGCGGPIAGGMKADLTLLDTETEFTVDPSTFKSMGRATPYDGMLLAGKAECVFVGGRKL